MKSYIVGPLVLVWFDKDGIEQTNRPSKYDMSERHQGGDLGQFLFYEHPRMEDDDPVGSVSSWLGCHVTKYSTKINVQGDFIPLGMDHTNLEAAAKTLWRAYQLLNDYPQEEIK